MLPIGTLIASAQREEQAEHHNSSSGGGKRPAIPEEDDAQKPTKAARVAEPASYVMSTIPAPDLRVVTSYDAEENPLHVPQWAVNHSKISTSSYGVTGAATGSNAPPTATMPTNISTPMYDRLLDHLEGHGGSLADDGWWQFTELQVGAVNELILCARTDKVEKLLQLLEVEGVELRASGSLGAALQC
jgi:hypothetical protein